jgi:acetyl-CoA acyltransferase
MRAVICGFVRSPFTPARKGELARVRPDDFGAEVIKALIARTGVNTNDIDDLICGCAFPEGEQGLNLGRMLVFLSGLPHTVAGQVVNRWCGSSMEAIHIAAGNIAMGKGEVFICAGVESMTRIPMGGFNPLPNPGLYASLPDAYISMGLTAENVAKQYKIERSVQEAFALESHRKAAAADMSDEITPVNGVSKDGCIRANSTPEDLAKLDPAFNAYGSVTAGTSSPLTDGAAAVLVTSEAYAKKHKLPMLAAIKSCAVAGLEPGVMGLGPIYASKKALEKAKLSMKDMDVIEINEAFAAQSLPCCSELKMDMKKVNKEGGAIALGHPLGASGARITGKAAKLLHRDGGKYALATACIGGGMGIATVLEKI